MRPARRETREAVYGLLWILGVSAAALVIAGAFVLVGVALGGGPS